MAHEPGAAGPSPKRAAMDAGIFVGIGGWTYAPWRGAFYPPGLPRAGVRIPIQAGRVFRGEAGQGSDLMSATVPK